MDAPETCPFCHSANVWCGNFYEDAETSASINFDGVTVPFWRPLARSGINTHREVTLCLACGQFWGTFNLREAYDFLLEHGSDAVKARLKELAAEPPPAEQP